MKTLKKLSIILMIAMLTSCYTQRSMVSAHNDGHITFQTFYDELSPYGQWVEDYDYGYLWVPHVNRNFQPYASDGYWTMTNYGNTWVSDFSWGWAPFHYGRWIQDDFLGWAWMPGYEWAPAWVSWRSGGGYYGWAPMGPRMHVNMQMNSPWSHWVFMPQRQMYGRNMYNHYTRRNRNIYQQTTIINNTYIYNNNTYYSGPSARDVERSTGRRVEVRNLNNSGRPGRASVGDRSVSVYQPEVNRNSGRTERPASAANRTSVNRGDSNSGRTTNSSDRNSNTSRETNRTTPQNTHNSGTVNRSNRSSQETTGSSRSTGTNRSTNVNRSTERKTEPTRTSRGTVNNRSNETNRSTVNNRGTENKSTATEKGSTNTRATNRQNSSSTTNREVNKSSTSNTANQKATGRSSNTTTRDKSNASAAQSRSTTKEKSSTRNTNERSKRGR